MYADGSCWTVDTSGCVPDVSGGDVPDVLLQQSPAEMFGGGPGVVETAEMYGDGSCWTADPSGCVSVTGVLQLSSLIRNCSHSSEVLRQSVAPGNEKLTSLSSPEVF